MTDKTDDTDTNVDINNNLKNFSNKFYSDENVSVDEPKEDEEEVAENEEDSLATENEEDEQVTEEEEADDSAEEEEEEAEPEPKPKKRNRAQERIEQLLERERLANERAHALELRLTALEAEKQKEVKEEAPPLAATLHPDAPRFDAVDKDGNPVYELGEFDPKFISDLTKFTIQQEMKTEREKAQRQLAEEQAEAARQEITAKWTENLGKAEAEVPEIRDNIGTLVDTFANLDPNYGEYLASTVMASDYGPQIMNYLSQNIGEAQRIVASGPAAATLALGRLEALFIPSTQREEKSNKQTQAPPPPPKGTKGSGVAKTIKADTSNLGDFKKIFFVDD